MLMLALLLLVVLLCVRPAGAAPDTSWQQPLAEKERLIERNIVERHNIMGLYPSQVEVPLDGGPVDQSTLGISNIAHSCVWTAYYLEGACFRYAFLKKSGAPAAEVEQARKRADEVFESLYRCQLVTGIPGLQARGYALGHGESYEERGDASTRDEWHQGAGEYADLRWRGDPSHHNYSASAHAFCTYYDLAAEGPQKERAEAAIDGLVGYWVDNDLIIKNADGRPMPILGMTDGKTLNTRILMAIAGAKEAWHCTGKAKYRAMYDRLVKQYGVRNLASFQTEHDFDDGQHVFCHLETLFRIEDDPELLAAYHKVADALWANHRGDAQSLFTYIYFAVTPQAAGREQALKEALFSLQTWPTDSTLYPRMNSVRPDLKPPYPLYAACWDNEYHWKGGLLQRDGWLSRTVTQVAAAAEDPLVLYAIDEIGDLYQSRDGAATAAGWRPIVTLHSPARAIAAGPRVRLLLAACDDGFYLTTTAGASWQRLPVPADGGKPVGVAFDAGNPSVLYAISTKAAWRSRDYGPEYLGKSWECLTADLPVEQEAAFALAPGKLYALLGRTVFGRALDQPAWSRVGEIGFSEYVQSCPWLVADPARPERLLAGMRIAHEQLGAHSGLQETTDGGRTWSNDMRSVYRRFSQGGMAAVMASLLPGELLAPPAIDPRQPATIYAATGRGVLKSTDGGKTWAEKKTGLDIPVARSVMAPAGTDWVFAGTPAGLFLSKDGGESWADAHLCLQFDHNTRREIGSGSYIDAYWRGRYYGFIDEATANKAWGK